MTWDVAIVIQRDRPIDLSTGTLNNGVYVANLNIALQLKSAGKTVCLITRQTSERDTEIQGVPVFHLCDGSDDALVSCIRHLGGCETLIENTRASVFPRGVAKRSLVIMHNRHYLKGIETFGRSLYGLVDSIICVSEFSRRENIGWGVPGRLMHVIPNGVDQTIFYPRNEMRLKNRLVFAGYCAPQKGIHIAVDAVQTLHAEGFNEVELIVCGKQQAWAKGSESEQFLDRGWLDEAGWLNWTKIENDVPGVTFRGQLSADELAVEFSKSSALILPSCMDTFGLVAIEAQACGCIPVLPLKGPFQEIVHDAARHWLHEELSSNSLCQKLRHLLSNEVAPEIREQLSRHAKTNYSWERCGEKYLQLISITPTTKSLSWLKFFVVQWLKAGKVQLAKMKPRFANGVDVKREANQ